MGRGRGRRHRGHTSKARPLGGQGRERNAGLAGCAAGEQVKGFRRCSGAAPGLGTLHPQHRNCRPAGGAGMQVLVRWKVPQVLVLRPNNRGRRDDILDQQLSAVNYAGVPVPPAAGVDCASSSLRAVRGGQWPGSSHGGLRGPCSIASSGQQPRSALDWNEILDRKEPLTCRRRQRCCTATRWRRAAATAAGGAGREAHKMRWGSEDLNTHRRPSRLARQWAGGSYAQQRGGQTGFFIADEWHPSSEPGMPALV